MENFIFCAVKQSFSAAGKKLITGLIKGFLLVLEFQKQSPEGVL